MKAVLKQFRIFQGVGMAMARKAAAVDEKELGGMVADGQDAADKPKRRGGRRKAAEKEEATDKGADKPKKSVRRTRKVKEVEVTEDGIQEELQLDAPEADASVEENVSSDAEVKKATGRRGGRKAAAKPSDVKVFLEFQGRQVSFEQIEERFEKVWTKDFGRKLADIKDRSMYIKPEDSAVYFVVNDNPDETGSFGI